MAEEQKRKGPVETLREGSITAKIWENIRQGSVQYNVTLTKFYKDKDGNSRETNNFDSRDLLSVQHVSGRAHDSIRERRSQTRQTTRARDQDRER